jgi:hypothetical protein
MTGGVRVSSGFTGIDELHVVAASTTLATCSSWIGAMLCCGALPHGSYSLCGKLRLGQHRLVCVLLACCAHLRRVRQVPEVFLIGARH